MSTTALKIIALIFMAIDHIGEFIPFTPIWFRWIGRMSAPLFFFCMAWGFYYTKSRKIYLLRMYLFGLAMAILNVIANNLHSKNYSISITNNIFVTLFVACIIIDLIDTFHNDPIKGKKYLLFFITVQLFSTVLIIILLDYVKMTYFPYEFYAAIFGNIFLNREVPFAALGILLYYSKSNKRRLVITYSSFCILYSFFYFTNTVARILMRLDHILPKSIYTILQAIPSLLGIGTQPIYQTRFYTLTSYYWMVIFALPFMLLYNGKKGKGYKYFFYLFYPIHIYLLYFIGNFNALP